MLKPVFMAMRSEAEEALMDRRFGFRLVRTEPFEVWRNDTRLVILSGIGLVNSSMAFAWAAKEFEFESAFNVGAAGATDIARDGMQSGVNMPMLTHLATASPVPVVAAGGVATLDDIKALYPLSVNANLQGAISGRAIYEGTLNLPEAMAWIRAQKA